MFKQLLAANGNGMNNRDVYAGLALQGIIIAAGPAGISPDYAATKALEYANALMTTINQAEVAARKPSMPATTAPKVNPH
jgi:hypothetical protein